MSRTLEEIRDTIGAHRDELRRVYKIGQIALFGSYARGQQRRGSDMDLLADFTGPVSFIDLVGAEQYLSKILKTKVDLIPRSELRSELRAGILNDSIAL